MDRIEAELRQAERLEVIRTELGYDIAEQTVNELSTWLVDAGFESSIALSSSREVTQKYIQESDTVDLHKEALKLVLLKQSAASNRSSEQSRKNKSKVLPTEPNDLRVITAQGKKQRKSNYDALKVAGYIKNPLEFFG